MPTTTIAERWLYERLAADPVLAAYGIHTDLAPQNTPMPYLIIQNQAPGNDLNGLGGRRIKTDPVYVVKAVTAGESYAPLADLAARIDAQLHRQRGDVAGGRVLACVREQPFRLAQFDTSKHYRHLGGIYRLQVQET